MTTPGSPARRFIKDGALLPGDIVLTTTPAKLSATIRKVTGADIPHAMLCVADGSVIDSTGEGVHARNPQWMVVEPGCAFHLLRPAAPVTSEQLQTLIRYAREQVSMPYTKVGAVQALLKKGWALLSFPETPLGALNGRTPRQAIEQGDAERVSALAREYL